ncbi:ladderlectin-like isoform X2 [Alosa alosa]|uniref:ladderlectin-like isoform X2 n=1 Tax=Alosa sapidissima TaxID=34773 RepID=UPI001C089F84|nr:ladderlectin-like isoform X2 [Alosa sapidissima]XP_048085576.1 ladderlectin-like isoform X2 [Alosa alosa]
MRMLTFSVLLCLSISLSWAATTEAVGGNEDEVLPELSTEDGTEEDQVESRFLYCPPGWFMSGSRCVLYVSSPKNWISAEKYCVNQNAALASVQSPDDYNFLQSLTQVAGRSSAWIGGFYFQGTWMWIDRVGFHYTNWASVNSVSSYQCIQMQTLGGWTNVNCASSLPFFCAKNSNGC